METKEVPRVWISNGYVMPQSVWKIYVSWGRPALRGRLRARAVTGRAGDHIRSRLRADGFLPHLLRDYTGR